MGQTKERDQRVQIKAYEIFKLDFIVKFISNSKKNDRDTREVEEARVNSVFI